MPTLTNHTEHPFEFPILSGEANAAGVRLAKKTIVVPRAKQVKNDDTQEAEMVPGQTEVTAEELKLMREHHVAKTWFKPTKGGAVQLEVSADEAKAK